MLSNFSQVRERAVEIGGDVILAVPWGTDEYSLGAVEGALRMRLVGGAVVYSPSPVDIPGVRHVRAESPEEAAEMAVRDVRAGEAHILMKGFLKTGTLLKAVLNRDWGLRTGRVLSDILIAEDPARDRRALVGMSDGGVNVLPDLPTKVQIVENAIAAFRALGHPKPKVALLSAVEYITEKIPSTVDAAEIVAMYRRGEIEGGVIAGPYALDVAVSEVAARRKGIDDEVAGRADILIVPNIEAGNILGKAYTYYAKVPVGHVIMGAKAPVLIPSRNESHEDKMNSIALGVIIHRNLSAR
ncbi:MAG: phosphate butyryltransferase [Thermotogae bacterium]|nr:phosphate butyryltransferase [Thermotogota bacterium]